jgi:hypothetical protein
LLIPVELLKGIPIKGTITFLKGDVKVQLVDKGGWHSLSKGDSLRQGSAIKTGSDSAVEVTFEDGSSFFVRDNTIVQILIAHKGGLIYIRRFFLELGRSITKVKGATGNESRFEIKTPSALAAARGTDFRVSVDASEIMRSEVIEGKVGVEAQKQEVLVNAGQGIMVERGKAPEKPRVLLDPPAVRNLKPIYKSMPLTFTFKNIKGASYYRIMLSQDSDIKDLVKEATIEPEKKFTVMSVDDGTYYLQSRSIDSLQLEGLPSEVYIVKVRVNPLPPFVQSPVHGNEYHQKKLTFKWLKVNDANRYHIQMAEDKEFKQIVLDKDDITDLTHTLKLSVFKPYFFRVSSIAHDGYQGAWSDTVSFLTAPPPPMPSITKPNVGEKEIKIRWSNLGVGITYKFQLVRDKEFTDIVLDKQTEHPEITFKRPEPGKYYVRTQGIDSYGYKGEFSPPQSLEVERTFSYLYMGIMGVIVTGGLILLL